ncbi:zinc finger protein, partial [Oryctes borbonicus]
TKSPILRVTQMNAIYFDNQIYKMLLGHVQDCLKHFHPQYTQLLSNEVELCMKFAILWFSIGRCDSTFGQKLLCTKYENITPAKKLVLGISLFVEYAVDKLQLLTDNMLLNNTAMKLKNLIHFCQFLNISIFLRNGLKPRLLERILRLNLSHDELKIAQRQYNSHYMMRELLWDSFIEILIYVLPLVNYHKMKRSINHLNPFRQKLVLSKPIVAQLTINTKCPHCNESPIIPHSMGCAHVFCYICLKLMTSRYEKSYALLCIWKRNFYFSDMSSIYPRGTRSQVRISLSNIIHHSII